MAGHPPSVIRALANQVARVLAASSLTPEQVAPGVIVHTDLPYQVPALLTTAQLGGEDLASYLDGPVAVNGPKLHQFWVRTLHDMWHKPGMLIQNGTYAGLRSLLRTTKIGPRVLRFAQPPGYPDQLELTAGIQLSLEVAHCAYVSLPTRRRIMTTSDYIVELPDGTELGVKGGRPLVPSPWTYTAKDEVLDFLEGPRGPITRTCHYDQISMLRSVVADNWAELGDEARGLDEALQALRYLSWGSTCPDLLTAMQVAPTDLSLWRLKEQAVFDAIDVMESNRLNDRQKLHAIKGLLVPVVLSITRFRRQIFHSDDFPFTMSVAKDAAVRAFLRDFYNSEVPCSLRRSLP